MGAEAWERANQAAAAAGVTEHQLEDHVAEASTELVLEAEGSLGTPGRLEGACHGNPVPPGARDDHLALMCSRQPLGGESATVAVWTQPD